MKGEQLSDALNLLPDDVIEETQAVRNNKKKSARWPRRTALCACLCVVICGAFFVPKLLDRNTVPLSVPFEGTEPIPAEGIVNRLLLGSGTTGYEIKSAAEVGTSPVSDSTDAVALPVYHSIHVQTSDDVYRLHIEEVDAFLKRAKRLGIDLTAGDVEENGVPYDPDKPYSDLYLYNFRSTLSGAGVEIEFNCMAEGAVVLISFRDMEQLYRSRYGELPEITADSTDAEVLKALQSVVDFAGKLIGTEYALDQDVRRDSQQKGSYIFVNAYVTEQSTGKDYLSGNPLGYEMFEREQQRLFICLCDSGDGVFRLDTLNLSGNYYKYIGDYELISLAQAEELLWNGYVLGGNGCPVCAANNPEVDFSEYDAVEVLYRKSGAEYEIPVYAFYKDLGMLEYNDGSGEYHGYAVAYVPAVEVEGMEEMFALRAAQHEELDIGQEE